MSEIRIKIIYVDRLEQIKVDENDLDISSILNKDIEEWFKPSNGRDGWEGLIEEIKKTIDDEEAELLFEFGGNREYQERFYTVLKKYGFNQNGEVVDKEAIASEHMVRAIKNESRGFYKEAYENYRNASVMSGNVEALRKVGEYNYFYALGKNTIFDVPKEEAIVRAVDAFEKAAEQGDLKSQLCLFEIFTEGNVIEEKWEYAFQWLKKAAEQGDLDSQLQLGEHFEQGIGVEQNCEEAFKWYWTSAQNGLTNAHRHVGRCYAFGVGVEKNPEKAIQWSTNIAEQGDVDAQFLLGVIYQNELQNENEAFIWYKKAAENDHAASQVTVANCYANGRGVVRDLQEAEVWYKKALENHSKLSAKYLEVIADFYYYNVDDKDEEAFIAYKESANKGSAYGKFSVGYCYETGTGVEKNLKEAFEWYKLAAEQEYIDAQYEVAQCYYFGKGVEKNRIEAFNWYSKVAQNGNGIAQVDVGDCYLKGDGVEKNLEKAIEWFRRSADIGCSLGQRRLGFCYRNGMGVKKDEDKAIQYFKLAADNDVPDAVACLMVAKEYHKFLDPGRWGKSALTYTVALLYPLTNWVTLPYAFFKDKSAKEKRYREFLKTDAGKDMMKYYRKAAELGNKEAQNEVKKLSKFEEK